MKYNQPFGVSDPNAGYINGNPATGVQGSIPPAESIEYPQREIVAMIAGAGLAPDNGDLGQLLKALKLADVHNVLKIGTNQGTVNQWSMACPALPIMPPPLGTSVWFKPGLASVNGGTTFSLNGSSYLPVVNCDLTPIALGDIVSTAWLLMYCDGPHWQVLAGTTRQFGALPILTHNANWYVNSTSGNDSFDGAASAPGSNNAGPFKTLQRAADEVIKYNQNGYNQIITIADGSYGAVILKKPNGSGTVFWIGNQPNPVNCSISTGVPNTAAIVCNGAGHFVQGFRLSSTGIGNADGIFCTDGLLEVSSLQFGPCTRYHMVAGAGSTLRMQGGVITIEAGAACSVHIGGESTGTIGTGTPPSLNILGPVNISVFARGIQLAIVQAIYASITGKANVHGQQYAASGNSIISASGGGPTYFPGDLPGVVDTGGQYLP